MKRTLVSRLINGIKFVLIILCLMAWITAFLLLRDRIFSDSVSGNILTNLTCLTFFGGLLIALIIGAMVGNFLRRLFWKWIMRSR